MGLDATQLVAKLATHFGLPNDSTSWQRFAVATVTQWQPAQWDEAERHIDICTVLRAEQQKGEKVEYPQPPQFLADMCASWNKLWPAEPSVHTKAPTTWVRDDETTAKLLQGVTGVLASLTWMRESWSDADCMAAEQWAVDMVSKEYVTDEQKENAPTKVKELIRAGQHAENLARQDNEALSQWAQKVLGIPGATGVEVNVALDYIVEEVEPLLVGDPTFVATGPRFVHPQEPPHFTTLEAACVFLRHLGILAFSVKLRKPSA